MISFRIISIYIGDDFDIHYNECFVHSISADEEGTYYYGFSITYNLTLIVDKATLVSDHVNVLDHFLISYLRK